jgi:YbbR domain-containing protein
MKLFSALREWLVHDFGWKIFSLLLAAVIWLTVHRILTEPNSAVAPHGTTTTYDNLPVQMVSTRADVHNYRLVRPAVKVTVSGTPEVMTVLQASQVHATVDLTDIETARDLRAAWRFPRRPASRSSAWIRKRSASSFRPNGIENSP